MKNKFFYNKFLPIISILLLVLFIFNTYSFGFTDEENAEIDRLVTTMINNSFDNGVTWPLDNASNSKHSFFNCNLTYNNEHCSYICVRTWNGEMRLVLNENTLTSTCVWSGTHDVHIFYYNNNLDLLGIDMYSLTNGQSISLDNVNYYFKSDITIYDGTGNEIAPFFQLTPPVVIPEITQTLVGETEKVQIAEQLKIMIVGFLKYLIVLVISLIAFWKGWQFLSTQLRKA